MYAIKMLFCINVLFSYPLQLYPANAIFESYLFKGWAKTKKRQMAKNVTRTIVVAYTVVLTLVLGDNVQKFLSVNGAMNCTLIAFTLPSLFHYKVCAVTTKQKVTDLGIVILSLIILVFVVTKSLSEWIEKG